MATPSLAAADRETPLREALRGGGLVGIVSTAAILLGGNVVGPALVLAWVSLSRTPIEHLGFKRPKNWTRTIVTGVVAGVALKLFAKAVVMPALGFEAANPAYHYLVGNAAALWPMILMVLFAAGVGEETVWRGFLFERLRPLFGGSRSGRSAIVAVSSLAFAAAHYADQGTAGVVQAVFTGFAFGTLYLRRGDIWAPMIVHAAYDLTAVGIVYFDLEHRVAHALFR
jgi:uncharacterized protein